ncbi:hypothetical protein EDD15DRAFT_2374518 [Pisolithus albus]|nr:hypothetical protein EDD15DRAFT_2374518 [Pisolithus albus]
MRENAEEMLKQLLMKASQVWREASGKNATVVPSFERDDVTFAVACSATEHYHLEQAFTSSSMVSQMFVKVKGWGVLSEQDKKRNALSLHLLLNEPVDTYETDDEVFSLTSKKRPASSASTAASRRHSKRKLSAASPPGSPVKRYKSAYQPRIPTDPIEYEAFQFKRRECSVDAEGNVNISICNEIETILVARNWQKHECELCSH